MKHKKKSTQKKAKPRSSKQASTIPVVDHPPAPPPIPGRRLVAAIDVGASAIRMDIAELLENGGVRLLESLRQTVRLGKDIFASGGIRQDTIHGCVDVLKRYERLLAEYGLPRDGEVRAVATSFVREARNRDTFMDRLCTATGMEMRVLDEAEEMRVTYLALQDVLGKDEVARGNNVLILVFGSSHTIAMYIQAGRVTFAQSFKVAALRTHELLVEDGGVGNRLKNLLRAYGEELSEQIILALPEGRVSSLVVMGSGVRFAAENARAGKKGKTTINPHVTPLSLDKINALADDLAPMPADRLARQLKMAFQDAEVVAPALTFISQVAHAIHVDEIYAANANLREGLLKEMTMREQDSVALEEQVVYSARTLAARYESDDVHSQNVDAVSMALFDELKEEHAMGRHERIMLRCAAILHDIGSFVSPRGHHKHSMYLIANSTLFGLSGDDMPLVALTARYHRKAPPSSAHIEFSRLSRHDRTTVTKMAAILRVADALERTHRSAVRQMDFQREDDRLVIYIHNTEDLTVERLALREKGGLFADVFGLTVDLREVRADNTIKAKY